MSASPTGRYLARASKPRVPGVLFTVSIDRHIETYGRGNHFTRSTFRRAHVTLSRLYKGRWSAPELVSFDTPEDCLSWMESAASLHRTNWVVAPVASDALTLLRWWTWAERQGVVWRQERITSPLGARPGEEREAVAFERLVVRGTPDIIRYRHRARCWQWVSGRQYLADGAGEMGAEDARNPDVVRVSGSRGPVPAEWRDREALHWSRAVRRMCLWWRDHSRAPWGATAGQCAVSILRSHCPPKTLASHRCEDTAHLERLASFGGRASCWYVGRVGAGAPVKGELDRERMEREDWQESGPVTQVDIRSMYPTILRDQLFPCKRITYTEKLSPGELVEASRDFGVIAHVTLLTSKGEYPIRRGERVYYPTGQFSTTLTGPEILSVGEGDRIEAVHRAALYRVYRPFAGACGALLELREAARRDGNSAGERWAKLLANSLGGKLAQRSGQWKRAPDRDEAGRWGAAMSINADTGSATRYRYIAGVCWEWCDDERAAGPYAAAFAYLTAYGRVMMRRLRELCPPRSVVAQDTDGMWVLPAALRALKRSGVAWGDAPGALREVCSAEDARWIGPRHYCVGGKWVLAGFSGAEVCPATLRVWDTVKESLWGSGRTDAPCEVIERRRTSALRGDVPQGVVGAGGWVRPFRADEMPE